MKIVLASESAFRRRAMDMLGLPYQVRPARIDEKSIRDENPARLTLKLAEAKAHKVATECPDAVIVAGDAVAAKGNRIFEKPPRFSGNFRAANFNSLHPWRTGCEYLAVLVDVISRKTGVLLVHKRTGSGLAGGGVAARGET
jgi:hypothetical protein